MEYSPSRAGAVASKLLEKFRGYMVMPVMMHRLRVLVLLNLDAGHMFVVNLMLQVRRVHLAQPI